MDATTDWYWEGNAAAAISNFLIADKWHIVSAANTHTKEQGIDIHATKGGATLLVEAKGYPSVYYRDPARAAKRKRTNPTNQAQHWYSHALLKVMRLQTKYPDASVAFGLPDFPRYRALFEETPPGLAKIGAVVLFVSHDGNVGAWGLAASLPPC